MLAGSVDVTFRKYAIGEAGFSFIVFCFLCLFLDLLMSPFGGRIGAACSGSCSRNTRRSEGLGDLLVLEILSCVIHHLSFIVVYHLLSTIF